MTIDHIEVRGGSAPVVLEAYVQQRLGAQLDQVLAIVRNRQGRGSISGWDSCEDIAREVAALRAQPQVGETV